MPVYRLSAQIIGRGSGKSAVAAAAYRAAERLVEAVSAVASAAYRSGSALGDGTRSVEHDFVAKRGVVHSEIVLPADAPPWMADRERLWNAVEAAEKRKDAQLAREIQLAIPRELDRRAQTGLVRDFVTEHFVALGMVADFAIHDVRARDGGRQPHSHVMLTLRRIDPESRTGFGLKETAWNRKELLCAWREAWAGHVNAALERAAVAERVDHRTLEAQRREAAAAGDFARAAELDREPEPKVGPQAWALERGGIATERGDLWREVTARTEESRSLYETVAEFGATAKARFLELRAGCQDVFQAFVAWGEEQAAGLAALVRGAAVAGSVGAVALGAGLARDTPDIGGGQYPGVVTGPGALLDAAEEHPAKGSAGESIPPAGRTADDGTGDRAMSDEELDKMIEAMAVEDRAAVVAEEREAEGQATAAAPAAGVAPAGMIVADEGWGRPEREAEVEVDPAAAWSMALSGGDGPGAEKGEGEAEAAERESAAGEGPEAQQADGEGVEEADPELERLMGELEAEDRAVGEQEIGGEELEAGG